MSSEKQKSRLPKNRSHEFRKTEVKTSEKQKSRLPKNGSDDFRKTDANKTNKNKTDKSKTNNLIHLSNNNLNLVKENLTGTDPDGMDGSDKHDPPDVIQYQFAFPDDSGGADSETDPRAAQGADYVRFPGSCLEVTAEKAATGSKEQTEITGTTTSDTAKATTEAVIFSPDINTGDSHSHASMEEITALLRKNVDYETLVIYRSEDQKQIDELLALMAEAIYQGKDITLSGKLYRYQDVRNRFEKYDFEMMQYVLTSLAQNTTKVKNVRNYLLATLINAPHTIDNFYALSVSHDLYSDG